MPRHQSNDGDSGKYLVRLFACLLMVGLISAVVRALLPLISVVVPVAIGWGIWSWRQRTRRRRQERLNSIFYELLQAHQGRTTVLDFAMSAQLSALEAKHFLDDRAREFAAHFEVSDRGDITYVFQTLKTAVATSPTVIIDEFRDKPVARSTKQVAIEVAQTPSLTQAQLAQRFNLSSTTISRKKGSADFSVWSRTKDPQGITWVYSAPCQRFYPKDL